jgi:Ring finger domain
MQLVVLNRSSGPNVMPRLQCNGRTVRGEPCKKFAKIGTDYCTWHAKKKPMEPIITVQLIEECPVCYDRVADKRMACGHGMCVSCYSEWTGRQLAPTCPLCRAPIGHDPAVISRLEYLISEINSIVLTHGVDIVRSVLRKMSDRLAPALQFIYLLF